MTVNLWASQHLVPYLLSPLTWGFFALGAIIGSFLNVCILRIPEGTFWRHARSVCPQCGAPIPAYLNLPILSYLILRGRTRCCAKPLSKQYPLVELLSAVAFVVVYWKFPFIAMHSQGFDIDPAELIRWLHGSVLTAIFIVCSVIDLRLMIIPDVISLPMVALTPVIVYLHPELDWFSALVGVIAGGGSLYVIAWLYWLVRREVGLGMGDVKLLAGIGGWLGYQAVFPTVFVGSVLGAVVGILAMVVTRQLNLKSAIPFGPFLAIGAWIHMIGGGWLQNWLGP